MNRTDTAVYLFTSLQVVPPQHHRHRGRAAPPDARRPRQFLGSTEQKQPRRLHIVSQVGLFNLTRHVCLCFSTLSPAPEYTED